MKKGITVVSVSIIVVVIIMLIGTITVSSSNSIKNAKKIVFSLEISNIQEKVDRYMKRAEEDDYPILTNSYTISLSDISSNAIEQFETEEVDTDNEVVLYELDLEAIDIEDNQYGKKETAKDVYVMSKETNKVYYLEGVKFEGTTYYTLTEDLIDIKERNEKKEDDDISETYDAPSITADGLIVKTLSTGKKEGYLSNIKVSGEGIKLVKYEEEIIEEEDAKEYFKSNGKTLIGDRLKLRNYMNATLYVENIEGEYAIYHCYGFPKIPEGFTASIYAGEKTIEEGFVIYKTDAETLVTKSQEEAQTTYDQFVWVPVTNMDDFTRTEWSDNKPVSGLSTDYTEPSSYNASTAYQYATEVEEYNAMKESVEKHRGFYIGRYEAGDGNATSERTAYMTGEYTVVIRKGVYVYNWVSWGDSMTDITSDVISNSSGRNKGKGAVYLSQTMYPENNNYTTNLIYGVQWDATLRWLSNKYNVTDSRSWGNHSNSTGAAATNRGADNMNFKTGRNEAWKAKNIYDFAGNILEWTMEAYSTNTRVYRGGYYNSSGNGTVPNRIGIETRPWDDILGFRVVLYLK